MAYSSRIANKILITPFDDKSSVSEEISSKLTKEEFCQNCYSHPKFEREAQQYMSENSREDDSDVSTNYKEITNQIHQHQIENENFELWLHNFENCKIYTINGNAGTGKTTFINYKKYKETDIKWVILDIHLARRYNEWISDIRTNISHFELAQSKVYGSIMNKLYELLFQGLDENGNFSLQVVYDNLLLLTQNYKDRFANKYPSGRKLLNELCNVMMENDNLISKVETSAELFKKYVNGQIGKDGSGIIDILNIMLLTLRCLSADLDTKYVIVFDNFERFIAKDEIYNKDIEKIRMLLASYIKHINQKGNCHRKNFKFIMTIRDSTARMCGVKLHASDAEASNLDLGKWYDTQDIICLKKKWYSDNGIILENSELVEQIIGDLRVCSDQTITGLNLLIDPLFNDNKRLSIDFIGSMVELPGNAKNIKMYLDLWNENTSQSRFAARSIIKGMILNELEKKPDKLFEHLKTYSTQNMDNGIGDARKILTILYNNIHHGNENEMSLSSVLSALFRGSNIEAYWQSEKYKKKRTTITQILFYMNSYNRRENDWIQFIDLQFKNSDCDVVVEDSDKLEQILSQNVKNCTIHLMPAGRVYLMYIVASFEFFSLRYSKNYAPLFTLIPTPEEMLQCTLVENLPCYEKIECVVKYAKKCIELLQSKEDTVKLFLGNSTNGIFHYMRIINQHREYINSFSRYIRNKYCSSDKIDDSVRILYNELCEKIIELGNSYSKYITNVYRDSRR